jgi:hypothetical protein
MPGNGVADGLAVEEIERNGQRTLVREISEPVGRAASRRDTMTAAKNEWDHAAPHHARSSGDEDAHVSGSCQDEASGVPLTDVARRPGAPRIRGTGAGDRAAHGEIYAASEKVTQAAAVLAELQNAIATAHQ